MQKVSAMLGVQRTTEKIEKSAARAELLPQPAEEKRAGGMGEPKNEFHFEQPSGCGASTAAVRKSEFEERGIS